MIQKIQALWQAQSSKDQLYLIVGAIVTCVFLLWALLCQPLIERRNKEVQRTANLTRTLTTVESLLSRLQQQVPQSGNTANGSNLAEIIDTSLRGNNLRMKGFQPGRNGEVRLYLENAAYKPLIQWLYDLEYNHNLQILELNVAQAQSESILTVSLNVKKL